MLCSSRELRGPFGPAPPPRVLCRQGEGGREVTASPRAKALAARKAPAEARGVFAGNGAKIARSPKMSTISSRYLTAPSPAKITGPSSPCRKCAGGTTLSWTRGDRKITAVVQPAVNLVLPGVEHRADRVDRPRKVHGQHCQGGKARHRLSGRHGQPLGGGYADPEAGEGAGPDGDANAIQFICRNACFVQDTLLTKSSTRELNVFPLLP